MRSSSPTSLPGAPRKPFAPASKRSGCHVRQSRARPRDRRHPARRVESTAPCSGARTQAAGEAAADPLSGMDWRNVFAIAVNEENAAGDARRGRPPTARRRHSVGSAYYLKFLAAMRRASSGLFLVAGRDHAVQGERIHLRARRSDARARSALLFYGAGRIGGRARRRNAQVEHAAEIGMEQTRHDVRPHRRAGANSAHPAQRIGAVKAVNAARMAMQDPAEHKVSLDQVMGTMYQTGLDMQSRYKETSLAGLSQCDRMLRR